jgi:hypothetical protein
MTVSGGESRAGIRLFVRTLLVYVAGAWVAVELVAFAVESYELPQTALDVVVLVAVAGGVAALLVAWFHGSPGSQKVSKIELSLYGLLALVTLAATVTLVLRDPLHEFNEAEGERVVLELPMPPPDQSDYLDIRWAPREGTEGSPVGMWHMAPEWARFNIPGVSVQLQGHPMMFRYPERGTPYGRLTVILPVLPVQLEDLMEGPSQVDAALVESAGLSMRLTRSFTITERGDTVFVRILGRFMPEPADTTDPSK